MVKIELYRQNSIPEIYNDMYMTPKEFKSLVQDHNPTFMFEKHLNFNCKKKNHCTRRTTSYVTQEKANRMRQLLNRDSTDQGNNLSLFKIS